MTQPTRIQTVSRTPDAEDLQTRRAGTPVARNNPERERTGTPPATRSGETANARFADVLRARQTSEPARVPAQEAVRRTSGASQTGPLSNRQAAATTASGTAAAASGTAATAAASGAADVQDALTRSRLAAPGFPAASGSDLRFSAHAQTRLQSRQINLQPAHLDRLQSAVGKAAAKGSKDALVLMDDMAFVVSVANRTVITVADTNNLKQNVFTNIDSAVIA